MRRLGIAMIWVLFGLGIALLFRGVSGCASCQYPGGTGGRASTGGAPGTDPIATGGNSSEIGGSSAGPSGTGGSKVDKACQNMLGKCPEVKDAAACVATINKINAGKVGNFDDNTLDCLGSAKTQKDVQACKGPVCGGVN